MKKVSRRKMDDSSSLNVFRSYSDMMSGLLLLFILIMAVCLMQAQKNYSEKLAEQANLLMKASNELAEELGRPATMAELAEHLDMDPSRTEEIMAMVLDAVNAMESGKFGADPSLFGGDED